MQLKSEDHEQPTNILATLNETHAQARYQLERDGRTFDTDPHQILKEIDIIFSDNNTALPKTNAGGGGGGNGGGGSTEDAIIAMYTASKMILWLTMEQNTLLTAAYTPVAALGDSTIRRIMNRTSDAPQNVIFSTYGDVAWAALGQTKAIYGAGVSWNSAIDSSNNPDFPDDSDYQFHTLINRGPQLSNTSFFECRAFTMWLNNSDVSFYSDSEGSWVKSDTLQLFPNQDFLFSFRRTTNANSEKELQMTLKNLTLDTPVQTFSTTSTANDPYKTHNNLKIASGQTGWNMYLGPTILITGDDQTDFDNCRAYLLEQYTGTAAAEESSEETSAGATPAKWFLELDVSP